MSKIYVLHSFKEDDIPVSNSLIFIFNKTGEK